MAPLVLLKVNPGGRPAAVKPSGTFAAVTVKLKGCPKKATALKALVTTGGALELPLPILLEGYKLVLGMISLAGSALYQ